MTHLYLEQHINAADYAGYTGRVYLQVFDEAANAVHFSGAIFGLAPYVAANAALHSRFISASIIRPHTYIADIPVSALDIPENAYGEQYRAEWHKELVSGTINLSGDKYIGHENFVWSGSRRINARLDVTQETKLAELVAIQVFEQAKADSDSTPDSWGEYFAALKDEVSAEVWSKLSGGSFPSGSFGDITKQMYNKVKNLPAEPAAASRECFATLGYSSTDRLLTVCCWLEKDHQLVTAVTSVRFYLYNSAGTVLVDTTNSSPGASGQFFFTKPDMDFSPDEVYFGKAVITAGGIDYTSGSSSVAWD